MNRRYLIPLVVAIVAFWAVMTVLLLKREVFIPRLTPDRLAGSGYADVPTDTWMAISLVSGEQVGYVNVRSEPQSRESQPGTSIRVLGRVRLSMLGDASEMIAIGETWVSRSDGIREFSFNIRSGGHEVNVAGTVGDGLMKANIETAGETYPLELPVHNALRLNTGFGFNAMSMPALKPGDTFQMDTFDPLTLSVSQAKVSCTGVETIESLGEEVAARVVIMEASGLKTRAWITENGEVLRAETPLGFVIERTTQDRAMANLSTTSGSDTFGQLAAVRPTGETPFRGARRMVIRITGTDPGTNLPQDDTQRIHPEGSIIIEAQAEPEVSAHDTLPDATMDEFLGSDPFVQSTSPRIREAMEAIVADAEGDWNRAMRLYDWVYESIEKAPVLSVPSALDVLENKRGDCNEHTVLYTALSRAAGIPTRIAIGIVWSEEYRAFYYHAWPEVYFGRWIWIDPTLGQPIADATHIKLLTGGIENWWQLVPYLGRIQVVVDDIE